ncbi:aminotransferase class I/II-fold pyridoxal phosphate-dependent enzyme, partial [Xanthomonas citri pv. citri]|nr:aminotransferase class I/II-fold pyridoxal phosphate-dependent enzyme [Xanthomonas citri pv. citri]
DAERHLAGQRERYRDARDRLVAGLREAGLDPVVPAAGYFVVVDLAPWGVTDAAEAAVRWTREAGVTGIPVGALCRPDGGHLRSWLRLAFCKSP